jgi:REP element-mobilizing transposase RayT
MRTFHQRHHIRHSEVPGGICHVTWRLQRDQTPLSPEERTIVLDILRRAPEFGAIWHAGVVMDDHVHALFTPGWSRISRRFVNSWKGASSRLVSVHSGRPAPIWQPEFYQRWIRHPGHLDICVAYIRDNPRRKWPGIEKYPWILP